MDWLKAVDVKNVPDLNIIFLLIYFVMRDTIAECKR